MRCYFLSGGHIVSVEELTGLSDEAAVAKAHELYAERKALYEGFEVWERTRVVFRHPDPVTSGPHPIRRCAPPGVLARGRDLPRQSWEGAARIAAFVR